MVRAELLEEVFNPQFYIESDLYVAQEKRNGKRRIICREGNNVWCFNKKGEKRSVDSRLVKLLRSHRLQKFVIDVELETNNNIWIFDGLVFGDEIANWQTYEYRLQRCHDVFDNFSPLVHVLYTARGKTAKQRLYDQLLADMAEGVVFKLKAAPYLEGEAHQHKKVKFIKEIDTVVIGPNPEGHDSVEIGVYDEQGEMFRVSGCSLIGRIKVKPGDVIRVRFLYATKDLKIVQPRMVEKRDDKRPEECVISQVRNYVYKGGNY